MWTGSADPKSAKRSVVRAVNRRWAWRRRLLLVIDNSSDAIDFKLINVPWEPLAPDCDAGGKYEFAISRGWRRWESSTVARGRKIWSELPIAIPAR